MDHNKCEPYYGSTEAAMPNITLSVDEDVIKKVRMVRVGKPI